ncbi:hypothetical protein KUV50_00115 [Membranicola marinus]|uniref:GH25 family protein n=1 Tax=Membranihabitans marinus TaxID=1227546 RepID=A0A953L5F2_9BACT|nr:hypothetical protein [Membranihabitans marinus]MBY5956517.1 hypothetical protein [Membranihabitans marinus]
MKKFIRIIPFAILSLVPTAILSAHALFVETNPTGKSGVLQEVTIYYAEPHDGVKEAVSDWWADISDFTLWLHHPDGSKQALNTTPENNHFKAIFTPDQNGVYTLTVSHTVNQLAGTTQYVFSASAQVFVGKHGNRKTVEPVSANQLVLAKNPHKLKKNKEVTLTSYENKVPLAESSFSIYAPEGWQKTVQTKSHGTTSFVPEWKGNYYIERIQKEEVQGQSYEELVQIYTTALVVR